MWCFSSATSKNISFRCKCWFYFFSLWIRGCYVFHLKGFVIKYSWEKSTDKSFKKYFFDGLYNLHPTYYLYSYWAIVKKLTEGGLAIRMEHSFGNIFMLQDVISLKPNVISAVYMEMVCWSLS
jgi:hypothetical protein